MKFLAPFLLITSLCFAQEQNRPELTAPLLQIFKHEAQARGVDISRLDELKAVNVEDAGGYAVAAYEWNGADNKITISPGAFEAEGNKALFVFLHEVGHHFRIPDCFECRYNILAGNYSARAVMLSRDPFIKRLLLNNYFKRIQNPKTNHDHF